MRNLLDHETSMDVMKPYEMWPMWDLSTTIQVWFGSFPNLTVQPLAGVGRTFVNATGRGAATCGSLKKSMVTGRCLKIETSSPLHGVFLCSVSTVSYIILLPEMTTRQLYVESRHLRS